MNHRPTKLSHNERFFSKLLNMLKTFGILLVLAVIAVLIIAATRPPTFHVERTTVIAATPEKIDPLLDDFHNWQQWSPWANLDPRMQTTFSGPSAGTGAIYEWRGNRKVGKGRMEILTAQPTITSIKLDFLSPMASHNMTNFILQPEGAVTRVTWTMDGPNTYMSKLMTVFVSMDKMIGTDFENGLTKLKVAAEH
jgi:hypothetical protein